MAKRKTLNWHLRNGTYFRIYHEIFESDAYRSLKCNARCLLNELHRHYIPGVRENVFLSTRDAASRLKIHQDTALKAFYELERVGLIKLTRGALWQQRRTREWRLTFEPYNGRLPTDEWRHYTIKDDPKARGQRTSSKGQDPLLEAVTIDL